MQHRQETNDKAGTKTKYLRTKRSKIVDASASTRNMRRCFDPTKHGPDLSEDGAHPFVDVRAGLPKQVVDAS